MSVAAVSRTPAAVRRRGSNSSIVGETLMDRAEFAALMKIGERQLRRWFTAGFVPPYIRLGKNVYFRRSAVHEWLATGVKEINPRKAERARRAVRRRAAGARSKIAAKA